MSRQGEFSLVDGELRLVIDIDPLAGLSFDAPARPDAPIQLYAPYRDRASMANVAGAVFGELRRRFGRVNFHNYLPGQWAEPAMMAHHGINRAATVAYFIGVPFQVPDLVFDHPVSIGGFVCETDRILPEWVDVCNRLDLVTVPSTWCRDAFVASGVTTPVMVVPHGLEAEYRSTGDKTRGERLVFFNTFHSRSFYNRKGFYELVRGFLRAFQGRDDVVLRLRTDDFPELARCRQTYDFGRLIEADVVVNDADTARYARIFSQVHCTVHPSRGEGFGLVPFQSVACETPVIAPHATGMADFLDDSNSVAVRTSGRCKGEGVGNAAGTYYGIDEDDLVDKLRYMAANWEAEYHKVRAAAPAYRQRHAWPAALAEFTGLIGRIVGDGDPARAVDALKREFGSAAS